MRRSLALAWLCGALVLTGAFSARAATWPDRAHWLDLQTQELTQIAQDPSREVVVYLDDGAPFLEQVALFDKAYAACRQALRSDPSSQGARANLGALYLWRDAFHPEESGNLEKAIDQFVIVLSVDPKDENVLSALNAYQVLSRVRDTLSAPGLAVIDGALRKAVDASPTATGLLSYARVLLFEGRTQEALALVSRRVGLSNDWYAQMLLGAVQLKAGQPDAALSAFNAASGLARTPAAQAAAQLGLGEAALTLKQTEAADSALATASNALPASVLEELAHENGLDTPSELGWSISTAYAAKGNLGKAATYLSGEEMQSLASDTAYKKNAEGVELYRQHDLVGARRDFTTATQLLPLEPVYWRNFARTLFELGRYQDSAAAFRKAQSIEPLDPGSIFELGMAYGTTGNYGMARDAFEQGVRTGTDPEFRYWAVDMAYAAGGWDAGLAAWDRLVGPEPQRTEWFDLVVHVSGGLSNFVDRAEARGAHYLALQQESVLYRALGEAMSRRLFNDAGLEQTRLQRLQVLNKIIANYVRAPLKPVPPPEAQALVAEAQPHVNAAFSASGAVNFDEMMRAIELYRKVVEVAPWWPEAHYTLALLASRDRYLYAYGELQNREAFFVARQEMNIYLALAPDDPEADHARQLMSGWLH